MSEYLLINFLVVFIPLVLTFEKNLKFYKNLPAVLVSIVVVGSVYIVWDIIATGRGDWSFNESYLLGVYLFNLPIEEILFFITVPYAIIFLFETARYYFKDKEIVYYCKLYNYTAMFFILSSLTFIDQYYTMTALLFVGLFFITSRILNSPLLKSKLYWQFILFTFLPFFAVNYFLTSIPIVQYSEKAIWGIRIATIPVEDFFYSFAMLSFNLLIYTTAKKRWIEKR